MTNRGEGYEVGDTVLVRGNALGGDSPRHDVTFRITKASAIKPELSYEAIDGDNFIDSWGKLGRARLSLKRLQ